MCVFGLTSGSERSRVLGTAARADSPAPGTRPAAGTRYAVRSSVPRGTELALAFSREGGPPCEPASGAGSDGAPPSRIAIAPSLNP
jgi:hypothetical protein